MSQHPCDGPKFWAKRTKAPCFVRRPRPRSSPTLACATRAIPLACIYPAGGDKYSRFWSLISVLYTERISLQKVCLIRLLSLKIHWTGTQGRSVALTKEAAGAAESDRMARRGSGGWRKHWQARSGLKTRRRSVSVSAERI